MRFSTLKSSEGEAQSSSLIAFSVLVKLLRQSGRITADSCLSCFSFLEFFCFLILLGGVDIFRIAVMDGVWALILTGPNWESSRFLMIQV